MNNYTIIGKDIDIRDSINTIKMPWYIPMSNKDIKNKILPNEFPTDNISIFLSKKNIYNMIYYVVSLNTINKTKLSKNSNKEKLYLLHEKIPIKMEEWSRYNNINDFEDLNDNILLRLNYLNKSFLKQHGYMFDYINKETLNVFQIESDKITNRSGKIIEKKYDEMLAQDYHTIDVHQPVNIYRNNNNFRNANKIPVWQKSMNTRNYDKHKIDGLQTSDSERASLSTLSKGYDMSEIYKSIDGIRYN